MMPFLVVDRDVSDKELAVIEGTVLDQQRVVAD